MQKKLIADTHTHTMASAHAYSTVLELASEAAASGLELLAITDHGPALPDSDNQWHFVNWHVCDRELYGVKMLYGAELSIIDFDGAVDLDIEFLEKQDLCIASFHELLLTPGDKNENTRAYMKAMENPYVNIIGHPDDGRVPVDFEELVRHAKSEKVLLELNNSSLKAAKYRLNCRENLITLLKYCEKYDAKVCVGTDAHFATAVGKMDEIIALIEATGFPEELVVNSDVQELLKYLEPIRIR